MLRYLPLMCVLGCSSRSSTPATPDVAEATQDTPTTADINQQTIHGILIKGRVASGKTMEAFSGATIGQQVYFLQSNELPQPLMVLSNSTVDLEPFVDSAITLEGTLVIPERREDIHGPEQVPVDGDQLRQPYPVFRVVAARSGSSP